MAWPIIFLMVVLKIPIIIMMVGLWWIIKQDNTFEINDGDGGIRKPLSPINPRRGPQGTIPPPKRMRISGRLRRSSLHA